MRALLIALMLVLSASGMQRDSRMETCPVIVEAANPFFVEFPDYVWIKNKKWEFKRRADEIKKPNEKDVFVGWTNCTLPEIPKQDWYTIEIATRHSRTEVKITVLHELVHAYYNCSGGVGDEHTYISKHTRALGEIFDDGRNQALMNYLSR